MMIQQIKEQEELQQERLKRRSSVISALDNASSPLIHPADDVYLNMVVKDGKSNVTYIRISPSP